MKKKADKRKKNYAIAVFFVVMGIILLSTLLIYSHLKTSRTPVYFNSEKKNHAEKLYDGIMSYDLDKNYPESPEIIMEIYNNTIQLIYGDMIRDEIILQNVIEQQRKLFSPELLEKNTFEGQITSLTDSLEELKKLNVYCIETDQKAPVYDRHNLNRCTLRSIQRLTNIDDVYRNYFFVRNASNGRWQIDEWEITDENFKAVEND